MYSTRILLKKSEQMDAVRSFFVAYLSSDKAEFPSLGKADFCIPILLIPPLSLLGYRPPL